MATILTVAELWQSADPAVWDAALKRYWLFVQPGNLALEQKLDQLDLNRIRELDAQGWYDFLRTEYFVWKYAGSRWLKQNLAYLERHYTDPQGSETLDSVRQRLLGIDPSDIRGGLSAKHKIRGLGTAGASGLLSLMYPATFATVDQFVVKALMDVSGLPEAASLARMKPDDLTPSLLLQVLVRLLS